MGTPDTTDRNIGKDNITGDKSVGTDKKETVDPTLEQPDETETADTTIEQSDKSKTVQMTTERNPDRRGNQ